MLVTEKTAPSFLERIDRASEVTMDTETTGLKTWTGDRVAGVSAKAGGEAGYFPFRHGTGPNLPPEYFSRLVKALSGKTIKGFHLRYDVEMMHHEGLPLPPKIEDAIIAALLMNENEPCFAMKRGKRGEPGLCVKYFGEESVAASDKLDAKLKAAGFGKDEIWKLPASDVAEYACDDLHLPERLLEFYKPGLDRWRMTDIFAEYNDYQRLLIEMETRGAPIDKPTIVKELEAGEREREKLLALIHKSAGYALNPNSPKQVPLWLKTENAKEETILRSKHPCAQLLIDYTAYGKRTSAYLGRFLDYSDENGILHAQLNLTRDEEDVGGTKSGRLSVSHPNLTAMPKPSRNPAYAAVRRVIVAPPGMGLVEADYSQAEPRIAGHYSQEPALFAAFNEGRDIYQEAADALGITRLDSKILNLAIQYGAGDWKVAQMLGISQDEAYDIRAGWHRHFPRIHYIMDRMQKMAERNHCIKFFTGRWAHFDGSKKSAICKSPYYTAWNRLVQGSVAEMMRRAMLRLWEPVHALGGWMFLQVHDSILFFFPIENLQAGCQLVRQVMEDFPHWDIAPKVDIKAGPNWLDMEEIDEQQSSLGLSWT